MSKYHAVSSGMVTRSALPSITRQRGTTTGSANLMLYGAGKTTVSNNTTFVDSSANAFTVTRNGDTVQSGFNPFSQASAGAGYFDGTGDWLEIPNNSAFNLGASNFTIEAWVYPTVSGTEKQIITKYNSYPAGFEWNLDILSSGVLLFNGIGTSYFEVRSTTTIPINTWTHVASVRNGATITIYINGVASGTVAAQTFQTTTVNVAVGRDLEATAASRAFTGYISNARVVKGTAVYTSNFTPPTSPLTAITNTSLLLLMDNYSIVNSTSTNLPVTISGNTTISTAQYPTGMSSSIYFDGNGDYLSIANNTAIDLSSGSWTIECWVYWTGTNAEANFLNKDGVFAASYPSYALGINSNTPRLTIGSGNGTSSVQVLTSSLGTLPTNTWVHLAGVRSGSTIYLFQNGQLAASATVTATITNGSKALIVGYQTGQPTSSYMDGYISNARICKGTALYTANFTVPSAPLSTTVTVPAYVTNAIYGVNQIP